MNKQMLWIVNGNGEIWFVDLSCRFDIVEDISTISHINIGPVDASIPPSKKIQNICDDVVTLAVSYCLFHIFHLVAHIWSIVVVVVVVHKHTMTRWHVCFFVSSLR